ncbi:MAG TPA: hypothetical protein VGR35_06415 [Tepidisphaeraceae bacterium]|nr:hypothetical protein [Tepidisphaeraceae bacterium]
MDLIKKNIVSVICGIVAIIAIVASFFPLGSYVEDLQASLDKSKAAYTAVDTLRTKERNLPILKLEETTPQPLGMFPSKDVIEKAAKVVKEVEMQSVRMRNAAVAMNKRDVLVKGVLPNPAPPYDIRFRERYVPLVKPPMVGTQVTGEPPRLLKEFGGGVLPQPAMIDAEKLRRSNEIMNTKVMKDQRGQVINQPEITQLLAEAATQVPQQMRQAVAEKSLFYVEVTAQNGGPTLDMAPLIDTGGRPPPAAIWWAQVMLWIQTDVLAAIKEVNTTKLESGQPPKNLIEAPVKRLARIQIPHENMFVTAAGQAPPAGDPAAAADAALPKVVQASPTGRVSNGMYDVVHFQIHADIEVEKIPLVIRTIAHNRLMSVYHVEAKAVDATAAQLNGYYYGDKPVAQVTMYCEALLLRHWTVPLMPQPIKLQLQIPDPAAPGAAPAEPAPTALAQ